MWLGTALTKYREKNTPSHLKIGGEEVMKILKLKKGEYRLNYEVMYHAKRFGLSLNGKLLSSIAITLWLRLGVQRRVGLLRSS